MEYIRADIISTLANRINSFSEGYRQNMAIIGDQTMAKTSIIKNLVSSNKIIKKDSIIVIYLEIKIEPFDFCAKRFIKSALFQLLQSDTFLTAPREAVLLIEDVKRVYPKTAQLCMRVLQDIERGRFDEAYSFMLDIPAAIFEETQRRCVLVLDEFQDIDNFTLKNAFGTLAKKIMLQKDTMYILISSRITVPQRILNEKLTMLFGNFEKISLPNLDVNMTRSFLQDNISNVALPPAYLDFISSFSGNNLFYMQIISAEIDRCVLSNKAPQNDYTKIIEYALTETIFKKTGIINQHFSIFFLKLSDGKLLSKSAAILIALATENKKQYDIAKAARLQTREVSRLLNKLIDLDIVARNGSFYRFKDGLFCFWLKSVYLKRIMSFSIDETLETACFGKEIVNTLNIFMVEFEKELFSRIVDLFKLFKNDVIQLNGRRHKFTSFDNVRKLESSSSGTTNILAASGKVKWLCTVKNEYIDENDITESMENLKRLRHENRIARSILISLGGISDNAHLMAKEFKLWVWDIESVNTLMELYGKPSIDLSDTRSI